MKIEVGVHTYKLQSLLKHSSKANQATISRFVSLLTPLLFPSQ